MKVMIDKSPQHKNTPYYPDYLYALVDRRTTGEYHDKLLLQTVLRVDTSKGYKDILIKGDYLVDTPQRIIESMRAFHTEIYKHMHLGLFNGDNYPVSQVQYSESFRLYELVKENKI